MKIIRDLTFIAIFSAIIIVLELALSFLPNIQLTFLLLILFSKVLDLKKSSLIVIIYVLVDHLLVGGISFYTLFALVALLTIPITMNTIFKKVNNSFNISLIGVGYSFIYSWIYALATVIITNVNFTDYLVADIVFEILLAGSTFLSILWLYDPLYNFLNIRIKEKDIL